METADNAVGNIQIKAFLHSPNLKDNQTWTALQSTFCYQQPQKVAQKHKK